jgi:hypothetical protein
MKMQRGTEKMKKICFKSGQIALVFVLYIMIQGCVTTQANITLSGPLMVLRETVFDFKEVKGGDKIQHSFSVLNKGDHPLEIKNVEPG